MPLALRQVVKTVNAARIATTALVLFGVLMSDASSIELPTVHRNRLAHEKSPYLLQHASNPVDWYPWGEAAFERARAEDKPIFLSIGYATCHWCHVMEHESFEDPIVASLMNDAFVNIKVDREERPDIDQVYMTVCQMLTGGGGWPLTILMTPDKKPFFAATYLPRESRHGRIGMLDLVPRVQQLWQSERDKILDSSQQILGRLESVTGRLEKDSVDPSILDTTYRQLGSRYDARDGGFGDRPKFPSPHNLVYLLNYWHRTGEGQALEMVERTLEAMRLGGIYDHVGFGFHRYSTDAEWLVPHFEKMLYDQAMLTLAYTEAFLATGKAEYERTVREVLGYVQRDMTSPEGGFYSAEDADSEGEEGLFYVWTVDEVKEVFDEDDADFAVDVFNLDPQGNFLEEATQRRTGANILHLRETHAASAVRLDLEPANFERRLETVRQRLFEAREKRIHPLKDDKILADWNGLMAAAMARAGRVLGEPSYVAAATAAVDFVLDEMRSENARLMHRYRDRSVSVPAFLDDYVFMAWACLELYDATLDPLHLDRALALQHEAIGRFWDDSNGGFFFTAADHEKLLVRQKEVYDGAMPSGNSVAMANLVRLGRLTANVQFSDRAEAVARAFASQANRMPSAHTHLLAALQMASAPSIEVVIAGEPSAGDTDRLLDVVRSRYLPNAVVLLVPDGEAGKKIRELAPFTENYTTIESRAAAYVCRNYECKLPTSDPDKLADLLREAAKPNPQSSS
jgi:uncharacterized protein YyaL (SSP411 family)